MKGRVLRYGSIKDLPGGVRTASLTSTAPCAPAVGAQKARKPRKDSEHVEQVVLFTRIRSLASIDVRYALAARRTHAIPNGGGRSKREAGRLKAEGVTSGVSDVFVALPSGVHHGLYIEMKSLTGLPSREQKAWLAESVDLGYVACVCRGADEAWQVWQHYVEGTL